MLDLRFDEPPFAIEVVGSFRRDAQEPGAAIRTIDRDTDILQVLAIGIQDRIDVPRAVLPPVAEDDVVRLGKVLRIELGGFHLRRPLGLRRNE